MKFDKYDVPQVREQGVEVGPASQMPTNSRASEAVAAGGRAFAQGLNAQTARVEKERETAETFVARQRDLEFAEEAGALVLEHRTRKGENALDTADLHDKIEAARQKKMEELPSEEARKDYDLRTRARAVSYKQSIEEHASSERLEQYGKIADSTVAEMINGAVVNYNKPGEVEKQIALGLPTILTHLQENLGFSDKQIEQGLDAVQAKVYEAVLNEYKARKMFTAGKEYLETIKDSLGAKAAGWVREFGELSEKAEVERLSTEAWGRIEAAVKEVNGGRFNPDHAKKALVDLYKPEDRARIEGEIEKEIAVAMASQARADEGRLARLSKSVRATGRLDKLSKDYLDLDDIGQDKADRLEETHIRSLRADNAEARRLQRENDSIAQSQFFQIPTLEERAAVTRETVDGMFPDASKARKEEILKWAVAAKMVIDKGQQASHKEFATQVNEAQKVLPKSRGKKFRDYITSWYFGRVLEDKPLTDEEVYRKINDSLLQHEVVGPNVYGFELDEDYEGEQPPIADDQPLQRARDYLTRPTKPTVKAPAAQVKPTRMTGADLIKMDKRYEGTVDPAASYEKSNGSWKRAR